MEISNVYDKTLELEGLLLLLKSENIDTLKVELIFNRLFEKISEIDDELDALNRAYMLQVETQADAEPVPEQEGDVETEHIASTEVEIEPESATDPEPVVEAEAAAETVDKAEEEIVPVLESKPAAVPEPVVEIDQAEETADDMQQADDAIADTALYEEAADADMPAQQPEPSVNITIEVTGVDVNQSAFAQKAKGDIRKVFTLNDNYKFRRQLFGNSQQRYAQALSDIEKMNSTYEAEDYIANTLHLDRDNDDVKDFMKIIAAYFMGK